MFKPLPKAGVSAFNGGEAKMADIVAIVRVKSAEHEKYGGFKEINLSDYEANPSAYELYSEDSHPVLLGAASLPEQVEIAEGVTMPATDVIAAAFAAFGKPAEAWNALKEKRRAELLHKQIDELKAIS
jgi:hypothetical protein